MSRSEAGGLIGQGRTSRRTCRVLAEGAIGAEPSAPQGQHACARHPFGQRQGQRHDKPNGHLGIKHFRQEQGAVIRPPADTSGQVVRRTKVRIRLMSATHSARQRQPSPSTPGEAPSCCPTAPGRPGRAGIPGRCALNMRPSPARRWSWRGTLERTTSVRDAARAGRRPRRAWPRPPERRRAPRKSGPASQACAPRAWSCTGARPPRRPARPGDAENA